MSDGEETKVHFRLKIDEDGFPPISVESLNGFRSKEGLVLIDNTPFFALGVALGDTVECQGSPSQEGFWFLRVHSESGNKALSIIILEDNCAEEIYQHLRDFGCYCEYGEFGSLNMLAVCVYQDLDYAEVSSYLDEKEKNELISYAELCI